MKPTHLHLSPFEQMYTAQQGFFKHVISRYYTGEQSQDVLQEFAIHLFSLYEQKQAQQAHLFDSKAWLRTILVNFCISQLRKDQAQKNSVWTKTASQYVLVADELVIGKEQAIQALYQEALGCVSKKEALILKMKYEYKRSSKEIEQRLAVQYVDVLIARIKLKIKKKIQRTDLDWL